MMLIQHLLSQCHVSIAFSVFQEIDAHLLIESMPKVKHSLTEPFCIWRYLLGKIGKNKQQPRGSRPHYIFISTVTLLTKQYPKLDNYLPHCFPLDFGTKHQVLSQLAFWDLSQVLYVLLPSCYTATQMLHEALPKYSSLSTFRNLQKKLNGVSITFHWQESILTTKFSFKNELCIS